MDTIFSILGGIEVVHDKPSSRRKNSKPYLQWIKHEKYLNLPLKMMLALIVLQLTSMISNDKLGKHIEFTIDTSISNTLGKQRHKDTQDTT